MFFQILTGWFVSTHYIPHYDFSFYYYKKIRQDVFYGWFIQIIHINFSSFIFLFVFFHILKSFLNSSFLKKSLWIRGNFLFILLIFSSFVGYVLPWGQMSFWGATVITNIFSALPYVGLTFVNWFWGDFSVRGETLNKFFSFHFLFPFLILFIIFVHLFLLHSFGSSNQIGVDSSKDIIDFNKRFLSKDILYVFIFLFFYFFFVFFFVRFHYGISKENFIEVDPLNTPSHIKPEWYFIFFYAILRRIPNKLGGVLFLFFIFFLFFFMFIKNFFFFSKFFFLKKIFIFFFIYLFFFLIIIGYKEIEYPYFFLTQLHSFFFIIFFFF